MKYLWLILLGFTMVTAQANTFKQLDTQQEFLNLLTTAKTEILIMSGSFNSLAVATELQKAGERNVPIYIRS
jgi:6-phosphofructokinase